MPGFEAASWFGIYVPSGTRPDSVARINHAVVTGLQSIRTESWLRSQGLQARNPDAIQYGELMRGEYEKWMPVLDQLNVITSYSIHYTKLYDPGAGTHAFRILT